MVQRLERLALGVLKSQHGEFHGRPEQPATKSLLYTLLYNSISSPGLRRGHVKKMLFTSRGVGEVREVVNQTVKSDRAIASLLRPVTQRGTAVV